MSRPTDDPMVRGVIGLGRLTAWQAVQSRKVLHPAEEIPSSSTPSSFATDEATRQEARRRPLSSLVGLFGIGLTLWCAWLLAAAGGWPWPQLLQAWGGLVGGLILIGASFWWQRRTR